MSTEKTLHSRCESKCELCGAVSNLCAYEVPPITDASVDKCMLICETCREQIEHPDKVDTHHWRCLNESMWSQVPAVQVMAWRLLTRLKHEDWSQDLLAMLYLDDDTLAWAQSTGENVTNEGAVTHVDGNGAVLEEGDTVTLVKDLNVKGANFTAKRGTAVRSIHLVADNPEHIEGRINGQQIVILTRFVRKSS